VRVSIVEEKGALSTLSIKSIQPSVVMCHSARLRRWTALSHQFCCNTVPMAVQRPGHSNAARRFTTKEVTRRTFNCQVERQLGLSSDLSSHAPFVTYCHTLFAYQTIPLCRPSTRRCMHKKKENGMRRGSGVDVQSTPTISFSLNINTYLLISFIQL